MTNNVSGENAASLIEGNIDKIKTLYEVLQKNLKDLEAIERRVGDLKVSIMDAKEWYDLKGHVDEVRARLNLYSYWRHDV
jgi:hypothetical protein